MNKEFTFKPLTPKTWDNFVDLFGSNGACGGCWCMWWRLRRSQFEKQKGAGNKRAVKKIVDNGGVPGIIAYMNGKPVAWCSVGPREDYTLLERSRVLERVDEKAVWSIVCFFIRRGFRRQGYLKLLIKAALQFAKKKGAKIVEAYPIAPKKKTADVFVYTGLYSSFKKTGFVEIARRSETRPIMRYSVK
ncbi:MAG: GNAT family N-acetyltransferase [Bacteroidota bacterium]